MLVCLRAPATVASPIERERETEREARDVELDRAYSQTCAAENGVQAEAWMSKTERNIEITAPNLKPAM